MRADGPHSAHAAGTDQVLVPLPSPRLPLRTAWLIAGLATVLLALAAGWIVRAAATPEPPAAPPAARSAGLGPIRVAVGSAWAPEQLKLAGLSGLDARTSAAFAPAPGLPAHAVVMLAPIDDATLVPAALRSLLARPLPAPGKAELAGVPAWHYTAQALSGNRTIEITVAPSSAGSLAVACVAGDASWVAASGCASGVTKLSIEDAAWLAPSADLALRAKAAGVVERLDARRVELRAKLRAATSRRAQTRIAGRLAGAYAQAAAALAPSAPASGPGRQLVTALQDASASHRALAAAAWHTWPARYRQARREIGRRDAQLQQALSLLK